MVTLLVGVLLSAYAGYAVTPASDQPTPPHIVREAPANEGSLVRLADGRIKLFFTKMDASQVRSITSGDAGRTWNEPGVEFVTGRTHHGIFALLDRDRRVHVFYLDKQGKGKINVDYTINVLHRVSDGRGGWTEPTLVFEGYTGALRGGVQLGSGRLLLPIGAWNHPDDVIEPNTGNNHITFVYSDDNGQTWTQTADRLTAPTIEGYNGSNYGAVEPVIFPLGDGRLWLLFRTQTGALHESFSANGTDWSAPVRSRFSSSNSPAAVFGLDDGRVVVIWNNAAMPPRHHGDGVYGGRDALHAAVSSDDGRTWRGFREVFRDPTRHDSPPKRGDRGTAYASAVQAQDGSIVLVTGQGERARRILRIDPDWLTLTAAADDFGTGLDGWTVFNEFGPAERWWRNREPGAELVHDDTARAGGALRLRRPEDRPGDGAVWNFPLAAAGRVELRFRVEEGYGGGRISLCDRFFNPTDDTVAEQAVYTLALDALEGVEPGRWHELVMVWAGPTAPCRLKLDGRDAGSVPAQHVSRNGISYLNLRSTATNANPQGWRVDSVSSHAIVSATSALSVLSPP